MRCHVYMAAQSVSMPASFQGRYALSRKWLRRNSFYHVYSPTFFSWIFLIHSSLALFIFLDSSRLRLANLRGGRQIQSLIALDDFSMLIADGYYVRFTRLYFSLFDCLQVPLDVLLCLGSVRLRDPSDAFIFYNCGQYAFTVRDFFVI